jgi:HEAT repeat protein
MKDVNSRDARDADKIIVGILATIQLLMSLAGLLMVPFAFMYGGASAWPSLFRGILFYLFCGLGSAIFLYCRRLAARLAALLWHAVLVGYLIWAEKRSESAGMILVFLFSALSLLYLGATAIPQSWGTIVSEVRTWSATKKTSVSVLTILVILVLAGLYLRSGTVGYLEMELHSPDSNARCVAARALAKKGAAAKSALPALKSMMDNTLCLDSGQYANNTEADIEEIGGIDPLMDVMRNGGPLARSAAAWYLRRSVPKHSDRAQELKQAFARGLKDEDSLVRQASVEGLQTLSAADLLPEIQSLAADPSAEVRRVVAEAIGRMSSVDGLRAALSSPDQQFRSVVIRELDSRRYAAVSVPALIPVLDDDSGPNAGEAATALGHLGRQALPALSALEHASLNSPDTSTRMAAMYALKQIGPQGLPAIEKALGDSDMQVRNQAIALLGSYGQAGVPALASFLNEPWSPSTAKAVAVLGDLGPQALPALHALEREARNSPDQLTRLVAIRALAKLGPPGYPAVSKLVDDPDTKVRSEAKTWLKGMRARYPLLPNPVR